MAVRVFIWGSCVSRDSFEYFGAKYELLDYVARQSFISEGNAVNLGDKLPALESPFQQRMNAGDAAGDAMARIAASVDEMDLLILDLCDERLGIIEVAPGSYLTRSVERMKSGLDEKLLAEHRLIEFGSFEHLQLWVIALLRVSEQLCQLGLVERTLVVGPQWASETTQGNPTPASFGLTAARANELFKFYYDALRSTGLRILADELLVFSDEEHRWGPAPFHYSPAVYQAITVAIDEAYASDIDKQESVNDR